MSTRSYLAVLTLTLLLGVAAAGTLDLAERTFAPARAATFGDAPAEAKVVLPALDATGVVEPAPPVLSAVEAPPEGMAVAPLTAKRPPYPRYEAFEVALRLPSRTVVPDAPTRIVAPETPVLDDDPELAIVFLRPELTPVALAAPTLVAPSRCCLADGGSDRGQC